MPPTPSQRLYEMGRKHRESEEQPITLPADLVQPESVKKSRPLPRPVSEEELRSMLQQIFDANDWIAQTHRNVDLISKTFLFDQRLSIKLTLQDLVQAVQIADREQRLDKNLPPPPPQFPDDDLTQPLSDGTMPLPIDAPSFIQRKASIAQMRNLVDRLKRQEVWQREQRSLNENNGGLQVQTIFRQY